MYYIYVLYVRFSYIYYAEYATIHYSPDYSWRRTVAHKLRTITIHYS